MSRIFLSHASADKPIVRRVASELENAGLRVWLDEAEIRPGDSLTKKIGEALEVTSHVIAFVSEQSRMSRWVEKELGIALTDEILGKAVKVIPVRLDNCTFPPFLIDKHYVDLRGNEGWAKEIAKLLAELGAKFWKVGTLSYYEAVEIAARTDFWRLPTFNEGNYLRHALLEANIPAVALWTSTWKDKATSYVIGFEKGGKVRCAGADHFGGADCVLLPK
jgi:hypothetical protein